MRVMKLFGIAAFIAVVLGVAHAAPGDLSAGDIKPMCTGIGCGGW